MRQGSATVTLEVYEPGGAVEITRTHARRVPELKGTTICELSDQMWEGHRTFPLIRRLLKERIPDVTIIPYTEMPHAYHASPEALLRAVQEKGGQAVIIGNAS